MSRHVSLLALALVALLPGCLSHMPFDDDPKQLAIHWRPDFEKAKADSRASGKPLLMIAAAGDKTGIC